MRFDSTSASSVFALVTLFFTPIITILAGFNLQQLFHKKRITDMKTQSKKDGWTKERAMAELDLEAKFDKQRKRLIWQWILCTTTVVVLGSFIGDNFEDTGKIEKNNWPWAAGIMCILAWIGNRTYNHYEGHLY